MPAQELANVMTTRSKPVVGVRDVAQMGFITRVWKRPRKGYVRIWTASDV